MAVIGAVLGDIAGSQFEFNRPENLDYKHCELFTNRCSYTDDTIMTLAVKKAILENADFTKTMREIGQPYPYSGYGGRFYEWMYGENPKPYNSFGNGSAMRVSFVGEHFDALEDVISMAEKSAEVTHNHPEGIKGAVVTAVCIWMARHGKTKEDIFQYVLEQYPAEKYEYSIAVPLDELEKIYQWNETCMGKCTSSNALLLRKRLLRELPPQCIPLKMR
ncbi:MAG: ADP-ribosylglycohydrolase family protein [Anaerobutyricum hallii]